MSQIYNKGLETFIKKNAVRVTEKAPEILFFN